MENDNKYVGNKQQLNGKQAANTWEINSR